MTITAWGGAATGPTSAAAYCSTTPGICWTRDCSSWDSPSPVFTLRWAPLYTTALHEKKVGGAPIDDTIVALLTFADGSLGELTGAVTLHIQRAQLEVYGSRAAALLNPWQVDSQDAAYAAELREWSAACVEPMPPAWLSEPGRHAAVQGPDLAAHAAGARCAGCHPGCPPATRLRPRGSVDA